MSGKRMVLIASTVIVLILALAWFHGGEEPLRPITQPVPMPAAVPALLPERTE